MQTSRVGRGWRRAPIAIGLFALSVLAPTIWKEYRLIRAEKAAEADIERVEPIVTDELPSLPRLDAYVEQEPDSQVAHGEPTPTSYVPDYLAGRVGQAGLARASQEPELLALELQDIWPPDEVEEFVGLTHGEPADANARRGFTPVALLGYLQSLANDPLRRDWAAHTEETVLAHLSANSHDEAALRLKDLSEQIRALSPLLAQAGDDLSGVRLRRAGYALLRYADVWQAVHTLQSRQLATHVSAASSHWNTARENITAEVGRVEKLLGSAEHAASWAKYLLLAELREAAVADETPETLDLVRRVLARYQRPGLTMRQKLFLRQPTIAGLRDALQRVVDDPVDVARLMATVEAYESSGLPSDAEEIASAVGRLNRSLRDEERKLADRLSEHYRAANLRVAVSENLLTRYLPPPSGPSYQAVADTIMGIPVTGDSVTRNELRVRLLRSHGDVARLELIARGTVTSETFATSGPVSTSNHTDAHYQISKMLDLEADGIRAYPARAEMVQADSQLQGMSTEWDGVPLIGDVVRNMANQRYWQTQGQRRQEVEAKLQMRAESQFEEQARPMLTRINRSFAQRILTPMSRLELQPEAVVQRPVDERMNLHFRVAGDHHLASHTPRPRAIAGSVASVQVHESMLNNVLAQLRLEGRSFNVKELITHVNHKLNTKITCGSADSKTASGKDKSEMLVMTFADHDALSVRLADDRLLLTVSLAKLEGGNRSWSNFQILVPYAFTPKGHSVVLAQSAELSLKGRLSNRSQLLLRGVLTNFFDSDEKFDLLGGVLDAKRFGDLRMSQAVIVDGWLGLSLTP